jgi:hypothetical protein
MSFTAAALSKNDSDGDALDLATQGQHASNPATFNTFAIWAFVLAFLLPLVGFGFSVMALKQIGLSGQRGRALAVWASVLSIVSMLILGVIRVMMK